MRSGRACCGVGPAADDGDGDGAGAVSRGRGAVGVLTAEEVLSALRSEGVPAALSVHPSAVPDDPQVVARELLRRYRHPAAGRFVQVGIPLSLSVDAPAVKGPAPTPAPVRRRVKKAATASGVRGDSLKIDSGLGRSCPGWPTGWPRPRPPGSTASGPPRRPTTPSCR